MRKPLLLTACCLLLAAALAVPAFGQGGGTNVPPGTPPPPPPTPTPKLVVQKPTNKRLIREGWPDRRLMGGVWYFRQDDTFQGDHLKFFRQKSLRGWAKITVPYNWNASDTTLNRSSVGWYRKEFKLPRSPRGHHPRWIMRFEGANHRAAVYLNGKLIGKHAGGYLPFEVDLKGLKRGRNRLVVKVSTLRSNTDLTHWRAAKFNGYGTSGWWNFGGLIREVYVRPVEDVDIRNVAVLPGLRCTRCAAKVRVRTTLRSFGKGKQVTLRLRLGKRRQIALGTYGLKKNTVRDVSRTFTIRKPHLWRIRKAYLYDANLSASTGGRVRSRYHVAFGVRRIDHKRGGIATINGKAMNLRGASLLEDSPVLGQALGPKWRSSSLTLLKRMGATVTRSHYPLHPAMMEALDRAGILYWSQAPVYQVPNVNWNKASVRRAAVQANIDTVNEGINHPSIFTWSIANELDQIVTPAQAKFISGAIKAIRRLDRTRFVAMDRANRIGDPQGNARVLQKLTAIGLNEYFGWYRASLLPRPPSADAQVGPYLDGIHRIYPKASLFITEFGAEANRNGPATERGTYQFQTRWMLTHLGIYKSRKYINGAIGWALRDFRVNPVWNGGNPKPSPPWNKKSLIDQNGVFKPAWFPVSKSYRATKPTR